MRYIWEPKDIAIGKKVKAYGLIYTIVYIHGTDGKIGLFNAERSHVEYLYDGDGKDMANFFNSYGATPVT